MEQFAEWLGLEPALLGKLIASTVLIVVVLLVRTIALRWVRRQVEDLDGQYRARKTATYAATVVVIVTLTFIWVDAFGSLSTYLGLVSAGVAIALADLLKNMAGWAYLLVRRPFRVGDRIEVQNLKGDVVDIRLFRFSVMEVGNWVDADQSTGRLVHVPNGVVFTDNVANYTEGFTHIWDEVPILITFESDYLHAEQIIRDVIRDRVPDMEATAGAKIRETARNYQIRVGTLTPIVYLSVRDSGVLLTARYLVDARQRRAIESGIWRGVLEAFAKEPAIALAYPTVRTYLEGPISVESKT